NRPAPDATKKSEKKIVAMGTGRGYGGGMISAPAPATAPVPVSAAAPEPPPVSSSDDIARFLAQKQAVSGAWSDSTVSDLDAMRTTSLATLAFIAGGSTSRKGEYQPYVRHAVEYIIAQI